jgi:pyruvate/2-oxoglutarate dehydrogenase complex dihydrolipoamide dehydrogenase (E3) component
MAAVALRRLQAEGVVLRRGATQLWAERKDRTGVRLGFIDAGGDASVEGTHLLVATGDEPDLEGLALRAAGIPLADGRILVDAALRSSNRRVHAIGVAAGAPAEAEGDQARLFLDRLFNRNPPPRAIATAPRLVRSDPQLARVGLTEAEARRKGLAFRVLRTPFAEDVRARAEGAGEGHLKVLVGRSGRILGAAAAGSDAVEAIAPFGLAMARGEGLRAVADAPISPFSAGQFGKRSALAYFSDDAGARPAGGLSRLLRLFG